MINLGTKQSGSGVARNGRRNRPKCVSYIDCGPIEREGSGKPVGSQFHREIEAGAATENRAMNKCRSPEVVASSRRKD